MKTTTIALALLISVSFALAADKPKATSSPSPPLSHSPSPPPPLPAASQAEADARVQTIVARYGPRLSATDRADLARLSHDAQLQLDRLRAYPLDPTDEPAHTFRAPRRRR